MVLNQQVTARDLRQISKRVEELVVTVQVEVIKLSKVRLKIQLRMACLVLAFILNYPSWMWHHKAVQYRSQPVCFVMNPTKL